MVYSAQVPARAVPNAATGVDAGTPASWVAFTCLGALGTDTSQADTAALRTGSSADDSTYADFLGALTALGSRRDALATTIKGELATASAGHAPINPVLAGQQVRSCQAILATAAGLSG